MYIVLKTSWKSKLTGRSSTGNTEARQGCGREVPPEDEVPADFAVEEGRNDGGAGEAEEANGEYADAGGAGEVVEAVQGAGGNAEDSCAGTDGGEDESSEPKKRCEVSVGDKVLTASAVAEGRNDRCGGEAEDVVHGEGGSGEYGDAGMVGVDGESSEANERSEMQIAEDKVPVLLEGRNDGGAGEVEEANAQYADAGTDGTGDESSQPKKRRRLAIIAEDEDSLSEKELAAAWGGVDGRNGEGTERNKRRQLWNMADEDSLSLEELVSPGSPADGRNGEGSDGRKRRRLVKIVEMVNEDAQSTIPGDVAIQADASPPGDDREEPTEAEIAVPHVGDSIDEAGNGDKTGEPWKHLTPDSEPNCVGDDKVEAANGQEVDNIEEPSQLLTPELEPECGPELGSAKTKGEVVEISDSESEHGEHDGSFGSDSANASIPYRSASTPNPRIMPIPLNRIDIEGLDRGDPPGSPRGTYQYLTQNWLRENPPVPDHNNDPNMPKVDPPAGLMTVQLYEHQRAGLAWLIDRENKRPMGGILADEQVRMDIMVHGQRALVRMPFMVSRSHAVPGSSFECRLWFMVPRSHAVPGSWFLVRMSFMVHGSSFACRSWFMVPRSQAVRMPFMVHCSPFACHSWFLVPRSHGVHGPRWFLVRMAFMVPGSSFRTWSSIRRALCSTPCIPCRSGLTVGWFVGAGDGKDPPGDLADTLPTESRGLSNPYRLSNKSAEPVGFGNQQVLHQGGTSSGTPLSQVIAEEGPGFHQRP